LGILVAADVLDTVIKPAHSYGLGNDDDDDDDDGSNNDDDDDDDGNNDDHDDDGNDGNDNDDYDVVYFTNEGCKNLSSLHVKRRLQPIRHK
jgi:hypothetical protein